MITDIHLQNFKRFRDLSLRTTDLTVLTGANGAGKTSVLHSLLLARQIARQPARNYVELNGIDTLELGSAEDVIHREASDEHAIIEVIDTQGKHWRWSFGAPADSRTLNAGPWWKDQLTTWGQSQNLRPCLRTCAQSGWDRVTCSAPVLPMSSNSESGRAASS